MAHARAAGRRWPVHSLLRRTRTFFDRGQHLQCTRKSRTVDQGRQRDAFRQDRDHTVGVIARGGTMTYAIKPLACDPTRIKGMSEKLIVSHYENNYGGAVNRLNAITARLAELDFAKAPGFVINGLKREELIANNSMILHELFFASLGDESTPEGELHDALARDFGSFDRWRAEFSADGQGAGRRLGMGAADLVAARQQARQSVGDGPHDDACRRPADRRTRHV